MHPDLAKEVAGLKLADRRRVVKAWWDGQALAARKDVNKFAEVCFRDDQTPGLPAFQQQWFHREWQEIWQTATVSVIHGATGFGKCLAPETLVLLASGERVRAKDVRVGMELLGPDSQPRRVLSTVAGRGPMYRIVPSKGEPWECNDVHVLTLVRTQTGAVIDIALDDYLRRSSTFKHLHKLFFPIEGVSFTPVDPPEVDPYFLGLWFGDGRKSLVHGVEIATMDPEVEAACVAEAKRWGLVLRVDATPGRCKACRLTTGVPGGKGRNPLTAAMRRLVGPGATIPDSILRGSIEVRRAFLAGFTDTDGHVFKGTIEISQVRRDYAQSLTFLARSVGLQATTRSKSVNGTDYQRVILSGNIDSLPIRIARKIPAPRLQKKDPSRMGFRVEPLGEGPWAGFTLDGDGRFLLGDCVVTHNTEQRLAYLVWRIGNNPTTRSLILGKKAENAEKLVRKIKHVIEKNEFVRSVFPKLRPGSPWCGERLRVAEAGSDTTTDTVESYGMDGSPQGARADDITADDVLDFENTLTEYQREKSLKFLDATVQSRLTTAGRMTLLANAWHRDDAAFRMAKRPGVRYGVYPAIDRVTGALLWPDFRPREWLDNKRATSTETEFGRMYLCEPRDESTRIFKGEHIVKARAAGAGLKPVLRVEHAVTRDGGLANPDMLMFLGQRMLGEMRVVVGLDLATGKTQTKRKTDFTVAFVLGIHPDGRRQVLWIQRGRWSLDQSLMVLRDIERRYAPELVLVEDNGMQAQIVGYMQSHEGLRIEGFHTGTNKWHESLGVEGIAAELRAGLWAFPGPSKDETSEQYEARLTPDELEAYREIVVWQEHLLDFQRVGHTPDDVMAGYFAAQAALRLGAPTFQHSHAHEMAGAPPTSVEQVLDPSRTADILFGDEPEPGAVPDFILARYGAG